MDPLSPIPSREEPPEEESSRRPPQAQQRPPSQTRNPASNPPRSSVEAAAERLTSPPPANANHPAGHGLQRFETLPTRAASTNARHDTTTPETRRRGRTTSSRRDLSPRSQLFRRNPSNAPYEPSTDAASPQPGPAGRFSGDIGPGGPRRSNTTMDSRFVSPGLRARVNTGASSMGRPRRSTVSRGAAVTAAAVASGRDFDAQSLANFTTAGNAPDTVAANQPYVDAGYGQLNPAYEQPVNVRPVWGLAKPLPRVIRPGMVPTRSEINLAPPPAPIPDPEMANAAQGRIEPTLKVNKISSQLQSTREDRENNLLRTFSRRDGPPVSGIGRISSGISGQLSSRSQAIDEEDDVGLQPLHSGPEQQLTPATDYTLPEPQALPVHDNRYPDDAASAITEIAHDDDLAGDLTHEDIPLPAYTAEEDEVHNLHTRWSVIRLRYREPLAELLAVTVQLTLGFCSDLAVVTSNNKSGNEATTDWAWGLATMTAIYIAGGISGAHLNPAISIMLYIYRGFPLRKVPMYVFAQILGAFIAAFIAFGIYQRDIIAFGGVDLATGDTAGSFITFPRYPFINASTAFFNEFTGTTILAIAVLALGDDSNAPPGAGMNALIIGLIVTVNSMAFGYNTGAALNPSRDLGPRLALLALGYGSSIFRNGYWVYGPWAATISGAIFGAFLYDAAIFVGGESPVNYPRHRMKRAGHKWRKRWGHRIKTYRRRMRSGTAGTAGTDGDRFGDMEKVNGRAGV